jgi:hypothetical protein
MMLMGVSHRSAPPKIASTGAATDALEAGTVGRMTMRLVLAFDSWYKGVANAAEGSADFDEGNAPLGWIWVPVDARRADVGSASIPVRRSR